MKIGIITLPLHFNYGGILQAYALQTVLEQYGHEVSVIEEDNFPLRLPIWEMPFKYGKRIIKNVMGHKCPVFYEQKYNREQPIIRQKTNQFINKYIHLIKYKRFSNINESEFDAIVVGSDQVWRPMYFGPSKIENAYLKFAVNWNIRRIAYAASFGTDEWEYTQKQSEACRRLLRKFDAVSIREESGVGLCLKHFNVKATQVLDPTMLLEVKDYIKLIEEADTPKSNGTLLVYILDETPEKAALIEKIANQSGLVPFRVNSKAENGKVPLQYRIQPPVEQWLRGFYDAEFVVTDSFHACVFSILFNKSFIVYGNRGRGLSRFLSLLKMFGLEDVLISNISEYNSKKDFNWSEINSLLNERKRESFSFLHLLQSNQPKI